MRNQVTHLLGALQLCQLGHALPAPQIGDYGENSGPVGGVKPPTPTVSTTSGELRGDESLLGGNAPLPDVSIDDSAVVPSPQLVRGQDADANLGIYLDMNSANPPEPIRGHEGATDPGPRTWEYEKLNPDLYAPPGTDSGDVPNIMWPFSLSHNRLGIDKGAGWARQQNTDVLPIAKAMAGVDMRLGPNAYRELHWHTAGEWALVLNGCVRVAAVDDEDRSFVDDLCSGDVWFFPPGIPHSLQAFENGTEFLLVFDEGDFSEEGTFQASEMFLRTPVSVMAKNLDTDVSSLDDTPDHELYIFSGTPAPEDIQEQAIEGPKGFISDEGALTYHWSQQEPYTVPGGSVKILDPRTFPIAEDFSAALVTVQPGAMREVHWHTTDEWTYFLQGSARITVFEAPAQSRTFDFTSGDVAYIEKANGHYVENTGEEDVIFLEILNAKKFSDLSVSQWLALTPRQVVKDTLHLSDDLIDSLPKEKEIIKKGNTNMTQIIDTGNP